MKPGSLEALIEEWIDDAPVDFVDLDRASLGIPELHGKYMRKLADARPRLRGLEQRRKELFRTLHEYYRGDLNEPEMQKNIGRPLWSKRVVKTEIPMYVEGDEEMVDLETRIGYTKEYVDTCLEILKQINGRAWVIKNALEYRRLTQFSGDA